MITKLARFTWPDWKTKYKHLRLLLVLHFCYQIIFVARSICLLSWLVPSSELTPLAEVGRWIWIVGEVIKLIISLPFTILAQFVPKEKQKQHPFRAIANATGLAVMIVFLLIGHIDWALYLSCGWTLWNQGEKAIRGNFTIPVLNIVTTLLVLWGFTNKLLSFVLVGLVGEVLRDWIGIAQLGVNVAKNKESGFT